MAKLPKLSLMLLAGGAIGVMPGCIDKSYDFEDFDDTSRIQVKDLTLPVEFTGAIKFKDVVGDLQEENELVHVDANGNYVLIQGDDFESDPIYINPIYATPDNSTFESQVIPFPMTSGGQMDFGQKYEIPGLGNVSMADIAQFQFEFDFPLTDGYIYEITEGEVDGQIEFEVSTGINCEIQNLVFSIPQGMYGTVLSDYADAYFNEEDATIHFGKVQITAANPLKFTFKVNHLDVVKAGGVFTHGSDGAVTNFHLKNHISVIGGVMSAKESSVANLQAVFSMSPIDIKSVSGSIKYKIDDIYQSADLYELLPEILRDPNTELALVDPQLYIEVENPFAKYGCAAHTNVTLKQSRDDSADYILSGDGPKSVISVTTAQPVLIDAPANWTGDYHTERFVFSGQQNPSFIYDEFAGAPPVLMKNLGSVIYGKGLPTSLDFIITDPMLDSNHVHNFPIGQTVGRVTGRYCFYAPLDFAAGSQVVYTQDQSGWDLSDFVVTKFQIATNVTSTIPVDVILSGYPIILDEYGNDKVDYSVKITSTVIEANATNKPVVIKMEGDEVRNLDGMRYTVTLKADGTGGAIGENISLDMNQVKVTVSGYYDMSGDDDDDDDYNY